MYFRNYGLRKTWLDNFLKSPFSEDPSTRHMVKLPNHYWNLNDRTVTYLLVIVKAIESEEFFICDMQNLKSVC